MKIIDAHQHFWIFDPIRDSWITDDMSIIRKSFLPKDLASIYKELNIDGCVAVQADQSINETNFLLELAEENDFIKGVVGWVDLKSPDVESHIAALIQHKKLKGFRTIMQGQPDEMYLTNNLFISGVKKLSDYNLTYDLLVYHHQLDSLVRFTDKIPDQKFILDHLGKPDIKNKNIQKWKLGIKNLANNPNIYCKISGMVTEADWNKWAIEDMIPYLEIVGEFFGTERLCFGSDWPVCLLASDYKKMLAVVEKFIAQLNDESKEKVLSGNTINFYQLN